MEPDTENPCLKLEEGDTASSEGRRLPLAPALLLKIYEEVKTVGGGYKQDLEVVYDALNLLLKNSLKIPRSIKETTEVMEKFSTLLEKKEAEIERAKKEIFFLKRIIWLLAGGMAATFLATIIIIYSI